MTKRKTCWFQNLFSQCILSRNNYLSRQVGILNRILFIKLISKNNLFFYIYIYYFYLQELRKQCTDLHNVIDTVQLRTRVDQVR